MFIHGDLPTPHELAAVLAGPLPSEGSPADSAPREAMEKEGSPMSPPKQPDDELLAEITANEANVGKGLGVSSPILLQPTTLLLRQNAFLEGEDHYGPHTPVPAQAPSLSATRRLGSFGSQSDLSDMLQQVEDAQQEPDQVGGADSVEPGWEDSSQPKKRAKRANPGMLRCRTIESSARLPARPILIGTHFAVAAVSQKVCLVFGGSPRPMPMGP